MNEEQTVEKRIFRLEKRLEREKTARLEAEALAEKGLRDLFLANQDLDRKVSERTEQLEEEKKKSEQAATLRYQFLAALSRQVRTPLNGVSGMLGLLQSQIADERASDWVSSGVESSEALLRLFSRLVLFVELAEKERLVFEEVSVSAVLEDIEDSWSQKALSKGQLLIVENKVEENFCVVTNKERLAQLFDEILDNCVSHADAGLIRVVAEIKDVEQGMVEICVTDTGPGIAKKEHGYHFVDNRSEFLDTLGMGYALIKRLAAALAADITQDKPAEGGVRMRVLVTYS